MDTGEICQVEVKRVCQLPANPEILQVPYQAFRVFIADVKPFDDDLEWTKQASSKTAIEIGNKEMNGRIVLTLGDTMWLVNLHERKRNKMNFVVEDRRISEFLWSNKLAVKNPMVSNNHLEGNLDRHHYSLNRLKNRQF